MELEKHPTQQKNKCHPNMPAFASEHSFGLTKREYFAGIILNGLLSKRIKNFPEGDYYTRTAVRQADELIKALNK